MRVAFNARTLAYPTVRGWNRYALNLLSELPGCGVELLLYSDLPLLENHLTRLPVGSFSVRVHRSPNLVLWENFWLPNQCRADHAEVIHAPANSGLPWSSPCPRVLTLHDAIEWVYDRPGWLREALAPSHLKVRLLHRIARKRAERVITVSNHARDDLVRHLGVEPEKIEVIPEAAESSFSRVPNGAERSRVRDRHGIGRPFFLYVGGWERRKNVPFLVRAFAAAHVPDVALVIGGGLPEQQESLRELAKSLGMADRVKLLGWVDETELVVLYAEALAFVYPSEYEGFGLQLVEAMSAGCAVFAARATSLPEVLGGGGETFALGATDELVRLLERAAKDTAFVSDVRGRGRERAAAFSWRQTAEATASLYRRTIEAANRR